MTDDSCSAAGEICPPSAIGGVGPISMRNRTDLGAEWDRFRRGVGPISMRNRTDFGAEWDRFRRGVRPISMRTGTDLGEGAARL